FSRLYAGRSAAWPAIRKSGGITFVDRHLHSGDCIGRRLFRPGTIYKGFPSNVRDATGQLSTTECPHSAETRCCVLTRHSGRCRRILGKHGTSSAVPFGKNYTDAFARIRPTQSSDGTSDRIPLWPVSRRSFFGGHIC